MKILHVIIWLTEPPSINFNFFHQLKLKLQKNIFLKFAISRSILRLYILPKASRISSFLEMWKIYFSSQIHVFVPIHFKIHEHKDIRSLLYIKLRPQLKNLSFDFNLIFQCLAKTHLVLAFIFVTQTKNLPLVNLKNGLK